MIDITIGKWSEPNAYSVRQSMFIAMLELARLISGVHLQESVTLVLTFSLSWPFLCSRRIALEQASGSSSL